MGFFFLSHKTPAECDRLLIYAAWEFSAVCETAQRRVDLTNKRFRVTKQKTAGGNNTERSDFIFLLRHRKLPESCQEGEGPLSCGSDSPKRPSLCHTLKPESDRSWRRVIYDRWSRLLGSRPCADSSKSRGGSQESSHNYLIIMLPVY